MKSILEVNKPQRLLCQPRYKPSLLNRSIRRFTVRALEKTESAAVEPLEESPYLEPFFRAFLLGLGSGMATETLHTVLSAGFALDSFNLESFQPLFYADHVAAIAAWVAFYIVDALAIKSVIEAYQGDDAGLNNALTNLVTLPRRMLPVRLNIFKQFFKAANAAETFKQQATATAVLPPPVSTAPPPSSTVKAGNILPRTSPPSIPSYPLPKQQQVEKEAVDSSSATSKRQKELADRQGYLTNVWYAAALSSTVTTKPVKVQLCGREVVLWRDRITGTVRCTSNACPHRGAPLSSGWVSEKHGHSCVVCPYHGWALDGEGRLQDVPAAANKEKGEWPRRPLVDSYTVEEKGGFIWLFYGDLPAESRPPIPYTPELDDRAWKPVYEEMEFDANHFGVFENAIDFAHIHYLHSDSFGNQDAPAISDMAATMDDFSVTATFKIQNKPVNAFWALFKVPVVEVTARAYLPSTSYVGFTLANGLSFITFVNTVPISATKSVNRFALIRQLTWDKTGLFNAGAWDGMARKAMIKILSEDKVMVEQLRYDQLPAEYNVRADLAQVLFRKLRQSWVNKGYISRTDPSFMKNESSNSPIAGPKESNGTGCNGGTDATCTTTNNE